jgi:hypothetical protein
LAHVRDHREVSNIEDWAELRRLYGAEGIPALRPTTVPLGGMGELVKAHRATPQWAEGYHQQYLHKNPNGYCGLGGTGVACPIGLAAAD